jgi:hypothetical protein
VVTREVVSDCVVDGLRLQCVRVRFTTVRRSRGFNRLSHVTRRLYLIDGKRSDALTWRAIQDAAKRGE